MEKAIRVYVHRAYFTSWWNATPFIQMLEGRNTRYYGRHLETGGYWITYGV